MIVAASTSLSNEPIRESWALQIQIFLSDFFQLTAEPRKREFVTITVTDFADFDFLKADHRVS